MRPLPWGDAAALVALHEPAWLGEPYLDGNPLPQPAAAGGLPAVAPSLPCRMTLT
jgi:hypothetical protein